MTLIKAASHVPCQSVWVQFPDQALKSSFLPMQTLEDMLLVRVLVPAMWKTWLSSSLCARGLKFLPNYRHWGCSRSEPIHEISRSFHPSHLPSTSQMSKFWKIKKRKTFNYCSFCFPFVAKYVARSFAALVSILPAIPQVSSPISMKLF